MSSMESEMNKVTAGEMNRIGGESLPKSKRVDNKIVVSQLLVPSHAQLKPNNHFDRYHVKEMQQYQDSFKNRKQSLSSHDAVRHHIQQPDKSSQIIRIGATY